MNAYTELPALAPFYLEDSWVLAIDAVPGELHLSMDLVLTPEHPDYGPAKPGEQYCYRRGEIVVSGVSRLAWSEQGAPPATDATGEVDYGNIDSWVWDELTGVHHLEGDWGRIELQATGVRVELS